MQAASEMQPAWRHFANGPARDACRPTALQVTVYVHPPMQDANDIEGGGRQAIEYKVLANGIFEISFADIDLATGRDATSKSVDRFQQVTVVSVGLFA